MSLGEQIIEELGRRKQRGLYFSFEAYQRLARLNSESELQEFLLGERFVNPPMTDKAVDVVSYLARTTAVASKNDMMIALALLLLSRVIPGLNCVLALYLFYMVCRRKPPRKIIHWPWSQTSAISPTAR